MGNAYRKTGGYRRHLSPSVRFKAVCRVCGGAIRLGRREEHRDCERLAAERAEAEAEARKEAS
jgi:hypothetical protein